MTEGTACGRCRTLLLGQAQFYVVTSYDNPDPEKEGLDDDGLRMMFLCDVCGAQDPEAFIVDLEKLLRESGEGFGYLRAKVTQ